MPDLSTNQGLSMQGSEEPTVLLLIPQDGIGQEIAKTLGLNGYRHHILKSPEELWQFNMPPARACLLCNHILDDGLTGIHILEGINQRSWPLPTLLLANQWTVPDVVQAMKAGADNFITLPFEIEELLLAVEQSLKQSQQKWEQFRVIAEFKARIAKLDKREREVINMVLCGHINKEIADHLDLALVTIKVYRSRAMKKLGAGNPAELARIAHLSGLCDDLSWPRRNS